MSRMNQNQNQIENEKKSSTEYVVFKVGDVHCGLDIGNIQEINKNIEITTVYTSPEYVRGVINLRGQIVTIIDMRSKFDLEYRTLSKEMNNVVVNSAEERIGLLVDEVDDIIEALDENILPAPSHMNDSMGRFFTGVYRTSDELIAILDLDRLLATDS